MEPLQFVYWLQGFMELADVKKLNEKQVQVLKDHIALVLTKKTPERILNDVRWVDPKTTCSAPYIPDTVKFVPQFTTSDELKRAQFDGVAAKDVPPPIIPCWTGSC